jgi:hypothetical protein
MQKTWGGLLNSGGASIVIDSLGDFYVAGTTASTTTSGSVDSVILLKYDSSGNLVWQRTWNSGLGNGGQSDSEGIAVDTSGNIFVTGFTFVAPMTCVLTWTCNPRLFILKFDKQGNLLWQKIWWGSDSNDNAYPNTYGKGVAVDSSGDAYVVGFRYEGGASDLGLLLKFNSTGAMTWQAEWFDGRGTGVAVDSSGNV